jgi:hypothetical protein
MSIFFDVEKGSILHKKMLIWSSFSVLFALIVNTIILWCLTFHNGMDKKPSSTNSTIVGIYCIWFFYSLFTIKEINKKSLLTHAPLTIPIYTFLFFIYRYLRNKYPCVGDINIKRKILIKRWGLK